MSYERIVVPLDGSLLSEYVLPQVERMATAFQSELTLLLQQRGHNKQPLPLRIHGQVE